MQKLKKLCIYDGEEWVDVLRIYEVPTGGYILHHIENEDLYFFSTLEETLEVAARRVVFSNAPRVGPC